MERHILIGNGGIIIGKAHIRNVFSGASVKSLKIIITESPGNLPCPVRTEIKENNGIPIHDCGHRLSVFQSQRGLYKLISLVPVIGFLDPGNSVRTGKSLAPGHGVIGKPDTVIIIIPVHYVIPSHNRRNFTHADFFHFGFQRLGIPFAAGRRRVPSIQETVNKHFLQTASLRQFQQTIEMCIVAVHTAVGQKPHQMKGTVVFLTVFHRL